MKRYLMFTWIKPGTLTCCKSWILCVSQTAFPLMWRDGILQALQQFHILSMKMVMLFLGTWMYSFNVKEMHSYSNGTLQLFLLLTRKIVLIC